MEITVPDYAGGSLVNLIAELESRLTGSAVSPRLHPRLAEHIPEGQSYVLCLFDGLGAGQLDRPAAEPLRRSMRATIDCPFPATTTVSLSVLATGLPPSQHGLLGYQAWLPDLLKGIAALFPDTEIFHRMAERWIAFLGLMFIIAIMVFPKGVIGTIRDRMDRRKASVANG